jgi:hypothetical protein
MISLRFALDIVGVYLLVTGFLDAYKYHWQSEAIKKVGLARGHSRKFINAALHNDQVRIIYLTLCYMVYNRMDWFLMSSSLIAVVFMVELWYTIYKYYPYRRRGMLYFKRPNMFVYFINSLQSNKTRKRL